MNNRIRKRQVCAITLAWHKARHWMTDEEYMAFIGREFGSPDFDRLSKIEALAHGAIIERCSDTGLFVGHVPDIAGAHAQGESREEVILNLQATLGMMSSHYQGRPVRKDPRKKSSDNERWLFDPIPKDVLASAYESHRNESWHESIPGVDADSRYLNILKMVAELFESKDLAAEWMQQPNQALGGIKPLDLIATESGIQSVRQALNAIATGGVA